MMTCEEVRLSLGAHALGALDPEEAAEVDTHLATCEACGAELLELEGVTAFLGRVAERDVELVVSPPHQVLDRLLNDRVKRRRRGRALLAIAASVAVLTVGGTVWSITQHATGGQTSASALEPAADQRQPQGDEPNSQFSLDQAKPRAKASPTEDPLAEKAVAGKEFKASDKAKGYEATVTAMPGQQGTELTVSVTGVPVGTTCRLVVVGKDGQREQTAGWSVDPENYESKPVFPRRTTIPLDQIVGFEIVDGAGHILMKSPV